MTVAEHPPKGHRPIQHEKDRLPRLSLVKDDLAFEVAPMVKRRSDIPQLPMATPHPHTVVPTGKRGNPNRQFAFSAPFAELLALALPSG
jgi:hypothetical protein